MQRVLDGGVIWRVVTEPSLLVVLLLTAVLAGPLGALLARRTGARRGVAIGFVVVLGAVLAATATIGVSGPSTADVRTYLSGFPQAADGFAGTREKWANIGLYLPLGVLGALLFKRFVLYAAALSFVIELWQAWIGRGGDAVDVLHNTAGAALGAGLVIAGRRTLRRKVPCGA